jgi:predicted AAA+ superfamily ATPase
MRKNSEGGAEVFERSQVEIIRRRVSEPRRTIQVVQGPRQVGKTTAVLQALDQIAVGCHYAEADLPAPLHWGWIEQQWSIARRELEVTGKPCVLALDEVQKIADWSQVVKRLWDEDARLGNEIPVVLLGSSPLLVGRGLTESLAGRFEIVRMPQWGLAEMRSAFDWSLEQFLFFGGYPGAAAFAEDVPRWRRYILDSVIETTLSKDVLLLTRVDKPALLRQLLVLACEYSGRELSFTKMMGELDGAGHTTTLSHYLELLDGSGLVFGLQKYASEPVRRRSSTPKLMAHDTSLITAMSGMSQGEALSDSERWGRIVESAVGGYLSARCAESGAGLWYWRDGGDEVDFVVKSGSRLVAIEVRSGRRPKNLRGLQRFAERFGSKAETIVVGTGGVPVETLLAGGAGF